MKLFRRNKDAAPAADEAVLDDDGTPQDDGSADATTDEVDGDEDLDADEPVAPSEEPASREDGPFDVTEVDGRDGRIDLGAMWVGGVQGMELRLEVDKETQQVTAVTAVVGESALQLQAFAAPRSSGLWNDIRREIAMAVEKQGGTVEEVRTDLGTELRTRMPSAGPDGRTVFAPATFLGVDGPRWFLRGVLSGRAAIEAESAAPLLELLRTVVVVRGVEPMAPREMLPLQLPQDPDAEPATGEAEDDDADDRSIDPFERGPEITEVR